MMTINTPNIALLYFAVGGLVIMWINRNSFNLADSLYEAGISYKFAGFIYIFLIITWPIWLFFYAHSLFNTILSDNEVDIE